MIVVVAPLPTASTWAVSCVARCNSESCPLIRGVSGGWGANLPHTTKQQLVVG